MTWWVALRHHPPKALVFPACTTPHQPRPPLLPVLIKGGVWKNTEDEILKAARDFKGPVVLGAPELQCGKYPDAPAICNDRAQFFTYAGKGKFDKAAGWLAQPND